MESVETYLDLLGTLVQPQQLHKELSREHFQQSLRVNLQNLWKKVGSKDHVRIALHSAQLLSVSEESLSADSEVLWDYACCCLKLLHLLREAMIAAAAAVTAEGGPSTGCQRSAPPLPPDVLGAHQQNAVLTAIQLLVCIVICPNLLPGVGVPLSLRSGYASLVSAPSLLSLDEKRTRLMLCSRVLLMCVDQPNLGSLVLSRCLGDLLAALMQLRYAPTSQATGETSTQSDADKKQVKAFSDGALKKLLGNVYPPLVVRELMLLQSGPPPQHKQKFAPSPMWLRKQCSRALSNILTGSHRGVQFVLKGMLDPHTGKTASDWRKCDAAAAVIAQCPLHKKLSSEEYYTKITPQVIELLHLNDKSMAQQYRRVAVSTMNAMYAAQPALTQRFLLTPILHPLMLCLRDADLGSSSSSSSTGDVIVCEKALGQCITDLHVLSGFASSASLLLPCLRPVLHPLYKLYQFSPLSLCNPLVHGILLAFFKSVDVSTAVDCLRFLAMDNPGLSPVAQIQLKEVTKKAVVEEVSSSSSSAEASSKASFLSDSSFSANCCSDRWMSDKLCFELSSSGSALVKRRRCEVEEQGAGINHQNNIDAAALKVVTLIKELNREEVVAEFFLHLLQELGDLLMEETSEMSGRIVIPGLPPSVAEMTRLQHNLLQLMLLATLCDQMPDTCFTNTPHILKFAKITLERAVFVLENLEDEDMGMFESETITMAMGLLTAVMGGAAPISPVDRLTTQDLLPLLEKLSTSHPDPCVQEMAVDIGIAIATHGMVLSDLLKTERRDRGAKKEERKKKEEKKSEAKKKVLIEELPDLSMPPNATSLEKSSTASKISLSNPSTASSNTFSNTPKLASELSFLGDLSDDSCDVRPKRKSSLSADSGNEDCISDNGKYRKDLSIPREAQDNKSKSTLVAAAQSSKKENAQTPRAQNEKLKDAAAASLSRRDDKESDEAISEEEELEQGEDEDMTSVLDECIAEQYGTTLKDLATEAMSRELEQAFRELLDPLIPVRGHALITLRRLVEKRDKAALDKHQVLLRIFRENVAHTDSYIYMAAIQGLAALVSTHPAMALPAIVQEYGSTKQQRSPELRLKLGEVMMKSCRQHGELVPQWRDVLLNSILAVLRTEKDHLVRASAVSNLAELCRLLRFSLAGILWEVVECVSGLVKHDDAVEVRQGAAMLITMLLQGLGQDAFKVLDSALKELYSLLKYVLRVEKEEAVKLHVRLALDELDTIMKTFLFPKQVLQKNINITHVPDSGIFK